MRIRLNFIQTEPYIVHILYKNMYNISMGKTTGLSYEFIKMEELYIC